MRRNEVWRGSSTTTNKVRTTFTESSGCTPAPPPPTSRLGSCYDSDDSFVSFGSSSTLSTFLSYSRSSSCLVWLHLSRTFCRSFRSASFFFVLLCYSLCRFCRNPTTLIARVRTTVTLRYFFAQKPITLITLAAVVSRNTSGDNATDSIPSILSFY